MLVATGKMWKAANGSQRLAIRHVEQNWSKISGSELKKALADARKSKQPVLAKVAAYALRLKTGRKSKRRSR